VKWLEEMGFEALLRELGPAGAIRFIQQYESGRGDYTRNRKKLLPGKSVCEIGKQIIKKRQSNRLLASNLHLCKSQVVKWRYIKRVFPLALPLALLRSRRLQIPPHKRSQTDSSISLSFYSYFFD
jgi:hypothetical protein